MRGIAATNAARCAQTTEPPASAIEPTSTHRHTGAPRPSLWREPVVPAAGCGALPEPVGATLGVEPTGGTTELPAGGTTVVPGACAAGGTTEPPNPSVGPFTAGLPSLVPETALLTYLTSAAERLR